MTHQGHNGIRRRRIPTDPPLRGSPHYVRQAVAATEEKALPLVLGVFSSRETRWEASAYRTLYFACRSMPTKVAHG